MSTSTAERQQIHDLIDSFPDSVIPTVTEFLAFIHFTQKEKGHIPNATTLAAMREAESGDLKSFSSIDELMADLHADDPED